jgi:hypothetical protein
MPLLPMGRSCDGSLTKIKTYTLSRIASKEALRRRFIVLRTIIHDTRELNRCRLIRVDFIPFLYSGKDG